MKLLSGFIFSIIIISGLSGCTASQQDTLLRKTMQYGRQSNGFEVKNQEVGDVTINYMERQGDGPVLLLVHGFSANKETWLKLSAGLPENYHIIAPDLAGHGATPEPDNDDYNLLSQTERLHTLMKNINIDHFHMIGNSMGGAISTIYATRYPQQLQSLILIDAAGIDGDQPSQFMQELEEGNNPLIANDEESFEYRWNLVMEQPPFVPWPIRPAIVRMTINRAGLNQKIFDDMLATRNEAEIQNLPENIRSQVTMPVLIIWGEQDRVLDVSATAAFKKLMPQAEVKILPEIGHVPQIEAPEETAQLITDFISVSAK